MDLPRQLLVLSHRLASAKEQDDASLRRAVSTAYYAVFHLLTASAARQLVPEQPEGLRSRAGRLFDHAIMERACKAFSSARIPELGKGLVTDPAPSALMSVARQFRILRDERMTADYDLAFAPTAIWAEKTIEAAEKTFDDWGNIQETPDAAVFMAVLAFPKLLTRPQ